MKTAANMKEFMEQLERIGELVTIETEVDPRNFELSSLIRHMEDGPNKAIFFKKVKGFHMPVVANLHGTIQRCILGCGVEPTEEEIQRYKDDPHGGAGGMAGMTIKGFTADARERAGIILLKEKIKEAEKRANKGEFPTKLVATASCKEVIIKDNIDLLAILPIPWYCEKDAGPFITPGGIVQKDPDTGVLNIGCHRHQVTYDRYGKNRMGVFGGQHSDCYRIYNKYKERGKPCQAAVCIGLDPVTMIMNCYTSPNLLHDPPYSEFNVVGAIRGEPMELVRCETVDLEVPANADIIIEGIMPPDKGIEEGPMAEYTEMYAWKGALPYLEVTAITHKKDAIFQALMTGRSEEHRVLTGVSYWGIEESLLLSLKKVFPSVVDVAVFPGSHIFHLVVSLKKRFEGEDKALLYHLMGTTALFKYITIVDHDIEPHNAEEVEWAMAMRAGANPDDFIILPKTHTFELDPEKDENSCVTRLGILATLPFGEEYIRTAPPKEMLDKTREIFQKEVLDKLSAISS